MANKTTNIITLTIGIEATDLDKLPVLLESNDQSFGTISEISSLDCIKGLREVAQAVADLYDYSRGLDFEPRKDQIQDKIRETHEQSCLILDGV